jgi:hypothetical protein
VETVREEREETVRDERENEGKNDLNCGLAYI